MNVVTVTTGATRIDKDIVLMREKNPATGDKQYYTVVQTVEERTGTPVDMDCKWKKAHLAIQSCREQLPKILEAKAEAKRKAEEETAKALAEIAALEAKALVANAEGDEPDAPVTEFSEAECQAALEA
jgi:hypothetical protein